MISSITIGGVAVAYKPGVIFTEKLTNELDEGVLVLPHSAALSVEPLDQVIITETSLTKYFLISTIKRTVSDFETPKFNYEIGLTSPALQLQRILLPNRSVTQWITGTPKTVYDIINEYLTMYAPSFSMSSALAVKAVNAVCPEFQWNRPTLFEVLNDLLSEIRCVVTMTDFTTISYLDLDANGSAIGTTYLSDEEQFQSVEDYASSIELEAQNAVVKYKNCESLNWVAAKNPNEATTTTDNLQIALEKPIYRIKSFKMAFEDYVVDATAYITEKAAYDLLRTSNSTGYITGDYKRNRFYFTQGSNIIDGLSYDESAWIGTTARSIKNVFHNAYYDTYGTTFTDPGTDWFLDILYYVEYVSIETVKFESVNQNEPTHISKLINNQDTSYVDIMQLSKKQQAIANAFANPSLTIRGKYPSLADVPVLGDIYQTYYKLSKRTVEIFDDFVNFEGIVSKNYVNPYVFTGIKSKRRYTQIADASDSFESIHKIIKEVTVSHSSSSDGHIGTWLAKLGKGDEQARVAYVLFTFGDTTMSDYIGVAVSAYPLSDSIVLTFRMADNQSAGVQVLSTDVWTSATFVQYLGAKYVKYVDDYGEFVKYNVTFYNMVNNPYMDATNWSSAIAEAREYPKVVFARFSGNIFTQSNVYRYKDNREITVESYQLHCVPDSNIFLGDKFFTDSPACHEDSSADTTLYVAYSTNYGYSKGDQEAVGTIASAAQLTFTVTGNHIQITVPGGSSVNWANVVSYAICDVDGNIYIAVNGNDADLYIRGI